MKTLDLIKESPNLIENAKSIMEQNLQLNYKDFVEALGLPVKKGGKIKQSQLKSLQLYLNYDVVKEDKKRPLYTIRGIYDNRIQIFDSKTKYCKLIYSIYSNVLSKGYSKDGFIHLSYRELMISIGILNEESKKVFWDDYPDKDYQSYLKDGIYPFLKQWLCDDLRKAENRFAFIRGKGFRLYKFIKDENGIVNVVWRDVDYLSKEHEKIMDIFCRATEKFIDYNYCDLDYIPNSIYERWQKEINRQIEKEYNGEYEQAHCIILIKATSDNYVKEYIEKIAFECPGIERKIDISQLTEIKVLTTNDKRVKDHYYDSEEHRKEVVDKSIKIKK